MRLRCLLRATLTTALLAAAPGCSCGGGHGGDEVRCDDGPPSAVGAGYVLGTVYAGESEAPLAGAVVRVDGVAGCVTTQADGSFVFPLAGGGGFKLVAAATGRTYAMRRGVVSAGRDVAVEPIFLPQRDEAVTAIGPKGGRHQSAVGGLEVDVPAGALARQADVRATRFTKGKLLPGALPETSQFTMAAEVTADGETLAKPVTLSFPNDYRFPAGTKVPVGYFNQDTGLWEAAGMGVVSDDGARVVYEAPHLSSWDCNFPTTSSARAGLGALDRRRPEDPCKRNQRTGKSAVDLRSGALRLDFELPFGRAFSRPRVVTLVYRSTTALPSVWLGGARAEKPADLPEPPTYAGVEAQVEGVRQRAYVELDAASNWVAFLWDGRNGRGELVPTGVYDGWLRSLYATPGEFATADVFGGPPVASLGVKPDEPVITQATVHRRLALINGLDDPVAVGWSVGGVPRLHVHPDGTVLVVEDGESRGVFTPVGALERIAGDGEYYQDCADGTPALEQCVDSPVDLALAPDGAVVFIDAHAQKVVRLEPTLTVTTLYDGYGSTFDPMAVAVAPDGTVLVSDGYDGVISRVVDGSLDPYLGGDPLDPFGQKPNISLAQDLAFTSDGSLYVADVTGLVVVRPDGTRERVGALTDPDPPLPRALAAAPDGSLILVDTTAARLRRLAPDGRITPVAGTAWVTGFAGDDGPATEARLDHPQAAAVAADGTIYVADTYNSRVRAVTPAGLIVTVAGNGGTEDAERDESGPATDTELVMPASLVLDAQGRLVVASAPSGGFVGSIVRVDPTARVYDRPDVSGDRIARDAGGAYRIQRLDGSVEQFDADGRLTTRADAHGRTTTFAYDAQGRLGAVTDALAQAITFAYGGGGLATVTGPQGRTVTLSLDGARDLVALEDGDGQRTALTYDGQHLLAGWTDADGRTATYRYDAHGRISAVEDGAGERRTYEPLETKGLLNDLVARGQGASPTALAPAQPAPAAVYVDGAGHRFTLTYDTLGEVETLAVDGDVYSFGNHPASGMPSVVTLPGDFVFRSFYDAWGRLRAEIVPTGTLTYDYDAAGRLANLQGIELGYDAAGELATIGSPPIYTLGHTAAGTVAWIEDASGVRTSYGYDAAGNLTSVADPLAPQLQLTRDARGNIATRTDGAGGVTRFTYDASDAITAVIDAAGATHQIARDGQGLLTGITTGAVTTTFTRDGAGRVAAVSLAGAPPWSRAYDGEGRPRLVTSPRGDTVEVAYDAYGRGVGRTVTWDSGGETAAFTYDAGGRLSAMTDDDSSVTLTYDGDGQLASITQLHDGMAAPVTIEYSYWSDGVLESLTLPPIGSFAGGEIWLGYDDRRLGVVSSIDESVTDPSWRSHSLSRDAAGRLASYEINFAADWAVDYRHDAAGRMTGLTAWTDDWRSAVLYSVDHTLAADGARLDESTPDGTASYSYDALRRVTGATYTDGRPAESYAYDGRGDRSGAGYVYDSYRRLTRGAGFTYTYDEAGRVVSRVRDADASRLDLTWDGDDKLLTVAVYAPGGTTLQHTVGYRYDADGKPIARTLDGATTFYIYDRDHVILEVDESGEVQAFYLHGPSFDFPLVMMRGGVTYAYLTDTLGTVRALGTFAAPHQLVRTYRYSAFGAVVGGTGTLENPYGFQGHRYDPVTGLVDFRTRVYDPAVGRFLSTDMHRFATVANPYTFPGDDAVNATDPFGTGPPRGLRWAAETQLAYDGMKGRLDDKAATAAERAFGKGAGGASRVAYKYAVSGAIDHYLKKPGLPSPYASPGPSVTDAAVYLYRGYKAKNPCERAAVASDVFTDLLPGFKETLGPHFKAVNEGFTDLANQAGR